MKLHEKGPEIAASGPGQTSAGRRQSSITSLQNPANIVRHRDPGTYGLQLEIERTPTVELRQMVHLLTQYRGVFGPAGNRRRAMAFAELQRRLVVR